MGFLATRRVKKLVAKINKLRPDLGWEVRVEHTPSTTWVWVGGECGSAEYWEYLLEGWLECLEKGKATDDLHELLKFAGRHFFSLDRVALGQTAHNVSAAPTAQLESWVVRQFGDGSVSYNGPMPMMDPRGGSVDRCGNESRAV